MRAKTEHQLLREIAMRASQLVYARTGTVVNPAYIENELRIVHQEVCTLRLEEMLVCDEANLAHDITGIHRHLDILDGSFREHFWPRFAK